MTIEIKICGLSTPASIEAAVEAGADMVGFVFFPKSPRYTPLARAAQLAKLARGRAKIVSLLVDADDDFIARLKDQLAPDLLQLQGKESIARVIEIKSRFGLPVMKAVGVAGSADVVNARSYAGVADRLMLDAKPPKTENALPGGNGLSFDWRLVAHLDPPLAFMLSGGLNAQNVVDALRLVRPKSVDVSSGVESSPGIKDEAKIKTFIAAARAAEREFKL